MKKTENIVYGIRPIIEAIESGKTIDKLFIQKGLHNDLFSELWSIVRKRRINYKHVPKEKIHRLTKKNHQGVFAFISPIDFYNIDNVIPQIYEEGKSPLILILDRITDIRNFGAIVRTSECFGVDAILIPEKESAAINSDAMKTSAGALNAVKICRTWNLKISIEFLKKSGLDIIGCSEKGNKDVFRHNLTNPVAIIIGSEKNGISNEYIKLCDAVLQIPMYGKISSLNASVASGIITYEILKQRIINN
ncbi:MAG: 23S rRNA (guanosine(2251)-2'-O)-methyltransferase RlmB [Flavobacteriales bacterium]|nr:23S rRNA (guanosine(2251)-2'-O)-methyltransferase RlmB [Flavobacteriales bacterium]|tara:strand:- start:268 stop:1014 length:747 start_codon:yes stop_codon:yes gene_type:complete